MFPYWGSAVAGCKRPDGRGSAEHHRTRRSPRERRPVEWYRPNGVRRQAGPDPGPGTQGESQVRLHGYETSLLARCGLTGSHGRAASVVPSPNGDSFVSQPVRPKTGWGHPQRILSFPACKHCSWVPRRGDPGMRKRQLPTDTPGVQPVRARQCRQKSSVGGSRRGICDAAPLSGIATCRGSGEHRSERL